MFSEGDFEIYRHAWRYALSPDSESELSDSQCKVLLKKGGWLVRNTFDFDCEEETEFWYLIKDSFGGMDEHSQNERKKLRHSFRSFDFQIIDIANPIFNKILNKVMVPIIDYFTEPIGWK